MTTKASKILDSDGVKEMGLVSPSLVGGCTGFKIRVTLDAFHSAGTIQMWYIEDDGNTCRYN